MHYAPAYMGYVDAVQDEKRKRAFRSALLIPRDSGKADFTFLEQYFYYFDSTTCPENGPWT